MILTNYSDSFLSAQISCDEGGIFTVKGKILLNRAGTKIIFQSAEPTDLRQSISGSALPFPNPEMAFGEINTGAVTTNNMGDFAFQVMTPNSYYLEDDIMKGVGHGKVLVKPHVKLNVITADGQVKKYNFDLGSHAVALRSLTNYPSKFVRSTGRNTPTYFATPAFN